MNISVPNFGPPAVDFSPLANLGATLGGSIKGWRDERQARNAFAKGVDYFLPEQQAISTSPLADLGTAVPASLTTETPTPQQRVNTAHAAFAQPQGGQMVSNSAIARGIMELAQSRGLDPLDMATAISYETGGTFDPTKAGPTTQYGRHRGFIQFGEPQAKQYGVDWSNPVDSQLGANGAIGRYLDATGVKPGMGLLDIYSAINAGRVGRYNASDANNGGAPGTVADKVNQQMAGHRQKAARLLGIDPNASSMTTASPVSNTQVMEIAAQAPRVTREQLIELGNMGPSGRAMAMGILKDMRGGQADYKVVGNDLLRIGRDGSVTVAHSAGANGGNVNRGLNPQYGVDANGNPVLLQLGADGTAVQTQLPEGVTLSKEPIRLDAGTHFVLLDPISRQPIGQVQKDLAGAERAKAEGKAEGEATANLPSTLATADNMISTIDGVLNDPALSSATGIMSWRQAVPGTEAYRFGERARMLEGQAFLQAFESLKGGGQITEVEGQKATQAIGRLSTSQRAEDYRAALKELRDIVQASKARAQQRAGQQPAAQSQQAPKRLRYNPATGALE
ncbi:hypothetical protein GCM10007276_12320 [Agaricicola taiwanensis]|uniref:Uncharacterized protein n=1 Tax=Agaricicola taiwanensis TaxID=591372 RepID=A0A8J2VQ10_9RHOB|nr:hypothetical protein [Agaricicola taiwanensis]GGE36376.1 hypothetical protein GCM10007276_12320 [Agaricicola taiwanensis]